MSLANEVQSKQSSRAGTYQQKGTINGRPYWVNPTNDEAIWYYPQYKDWAIGPLSNLGTNWRSITSVGALEANCPDDDRADWKYWDGSWKKTKYTSDVQVECQGKCFVDIETNDVRASSLVELILTISSEFC